MNKTGAFALEINPNLKKEEIVMATKGNKYATNQGGVIKGEKPVKDQPKATVVKGKDLRSGK